MSKKKHYESIEIAENYAETRPELKELIGDFIKMSKHPKAMCKISIGTFNKKENSFLSKLTSNVRFASTLFSNFEEEPQVFIRNHSENVCMFNLTGIEKILYHRADIIPKPLDYEQKIYIFSYNGDDYRLKITFES